MTLLINAVVGNSCFPIAPNPEDSEASPGLGPADAAHGRSGCGAVLGQHGSLPWAPGLSLCLSCPETLTFPFFGGAIRRLCKAAGAAVQCCLREMPRASPWSCLDF